MGLVQQLGLDLLQRPGSLRLLLGLFIRQDGLINGQEHSHAASTTAPRIQVSDRMRSFSLGKSERANRSVIVSAVAGNGRSGPIAACPASHFCVVGGRSRTVGNDPDAASKANFVSAYLPGDSGVT